MVEKEERTPRAAKLGGDDGSGAPETAGGSRGEVKPPCYVRQRRGEGTDARQRERQPQEPPAMAPAAAAPGGASGRGKMVDAGGGMQVKAAKPYGKGGKIFGLEASVMH